MKTGAPALFEAYPKRIDVPCALCLSAILLVLGLYLPVITLNELVFWKSTFSVWTGIGSLMEEGHYVLGSVIFLFSIIFPITKLTVLAGVWFLRLEESQRRFLVYWMTILGKWSMLDVFVVAVTIVVTKISKFASAEPRVGIYFFGASIFLTLLMTECIERLLKNPSKSLS